MAINDKLVANFYLGAPDNENQCALGFRNPPNGNNFSTIVDQTVFAAGFNENYIIIKQHPHPSGSASLDKKITNYFIIPIEHGLRRSPMAIGPLTLEEFKARRVQLAIPDSLVFTKVYADLQ